MKTQLTVCFVLLAIQFSEKGFAQSLQWEQNYGGLGTDVMQDLQPTMGGGYILGGYSNSDMIFNKSENSQGGNDMWVIKANTTGGVEWQNTIGGNTEDLLYSLQQTSDGGYILGGFSNSGISGDKAEASRGGYDFWIVKLDGAGTIVWQKTLGGAGIDKLYSIQQTTDGGYIAGGSSNSNQSGEKSENSRGKLDYWIVKLDNSGNIQWQKTFGGTENEILLSIRQTSDGGYICGGQSNSNATGDKTENCRGGSDYWVLKLDGSGTIEWQRTYGGSQAESLRSVKQTADGGYLLCGYSQSGISGDKTEPGKGGYDLWPIKTDDTGMIQWQKSIGGSLDDHANSFVEFPGTGYLFAAHSESDISGDKTENSQEFDFWVIVTDLQGNITGQKTFGGDGYDFAYAAQLSPSGNYIIGGSSISSGFSFSDHDFWLVSFYPPASTGIHAIPTGAPLGLSPSITTQSMTVTLADCTGYAELELYTMLGEKVRTLYAGSIAQSTWSSNFDISDLCNGIYLVSLKGARNATARVVKQ